MTERWFTTPGEVGTIRVQHDGSRWLLSDPETEGPVKCVLRGGSTPEPSESPAEIDGEVTKYMYSDGDSPDFLFYTAESMNSKSSTDSEAATQAESTDSPVSADTDEYPHRRIINLTGDGEYVTVEAIVDDITEMNDDESNKPKIRGKLRDEESGLVRTFLIWSDTPHPYMEVGTKFRLTGVKDHYYERTDQEQVIITD